MQSKRPDWAVCSDNPLFVEEPMIGFDFPHAADAVRFLGKHYKDVQSVFVRWNGAVLDANGREVNIPKMPNNEHTRAFGSLLEAEQESIIGICAAEQTVDDDTFRTAQTFVDPVVMGQYLDKSSASALLGASLAMRATQPNEISAETANEIGSRCASTIVMSSLDAPPTAKLTIDDIVGIVEDEDGISFAKSRPIDDWADWLAEHNHLRWCEFDELMEAKRHFDETFSLDAEEVVDCALFGRWPDDALVLDYQRAIHRPDARAVTKGRSLVASRGCPVVLAWNHERDEPPKKKYQALLFLDDGLGEFDERKPKPLRIEHTDRLAAAVVPHRIGESTAGGSTERLRVDTKMRTRLWERRQMPLTERLRGLKSEWERLNDNDGLPDKYKRIVGDRMKAEIEIIRLRRWGIDRADRLEVDIKTRSNKGIGIGG